MLPAALWWGVVVAVAAAAASLVVLALQVAQLVRGVAELLHELRAAGPRRPGPPPRRPMGFVRYDAPPPPGPPSSALVIWARTSDPA
jgi:hypothetical protein